MIIIAMEKYLSSSAMMDISQQDLASLEKSSKFCQHILNLKQIQAIRNIDICQKYSSHTNSRIGLNTISSDQLKNSILNINIINR